MTERRKLRSGEPSRISTRLKIALQKNRKTRCLLKEYWGLFQGHLYLTSSDKVVFGKSMSVLSILLGYQLKRRERRKIVVLKNRCKIVKVCTTKIKLYNDIECRESGTSIREWVTLVITLKSPLSAATPGGFKLQKNNSCTPCVPMFIIVWAKLTKLKFAAEKVCLFMRDTSWKSSCPLYFHV